MSKKEDRGTLTADERRMYEVAFRALNEDAVRRGATSPRALLDEELLAWAEREGLTRADVVRINF